MLISRILSSPSVTSQPRRSGPKTVFATLAAPGPRTVASPANEVRVPSAIASPKRVALAAPKHRFESLTPLQQAIADDDMPSFERHIDAGRQPWPDANGQHALTLAAIMNRPAMLVRLLQTGAKPVHGDLLGNTPLHWAALTNNDAMAESLCIHRAPEDARNLFFGTPADCAQLNPTSTPVGLSLHVVLPEGLRTWSAAETQRHLGLELLSSSQIRPSWLSHLLTLMTDEDCMEGIYRALPKRPLPGGPEAEVALRHYGETMGWGVCALEPIEAGRFVGSYLGRVETVRDSQPFNPYLATPLAGRAALGRLRMGINARRAGNWVSRINSADSEERANLIPYEGFRAGAPALDLWSSRPIAPGEQLLWYYGKAYWQRHPTPCA